MANTLSPCSQEASYTMCGRGLLKDINTETIDAPCPYIAKAKEYAISADIDNYSIIILGNPTSPEIIALKSCIKSEVYICEKPEELPDKKFTKVAIICQTTQNIQNLKRLIDHLLLRSNEIRVFNTICDATGIE